MANAKLKDDNQANASQGEGDRDGPLLDMSDSAVKKFIKAAKAKGYVTYEDLNKVLPSEEVSSDQIEDLYATLSEMGINVVESEEDEGEEAAPEGVDATASREVATKASVPTTTAAKSEPSERTDDPVRMYLREMGTVELLSREGEIAIAKRIEAGREAMIAGLCESPLTFQAIIIWRDELNDGTILLRDIIDLEATYDGPDAKNAAAAPNADGTPADGTAANGAAVEGQPAANENEQGNTAGGADGNAASGTAEGGSSEGESSESDDEDDDEYENAMSLALAVWSSWASGPA